MHDLITISPTGQTSNTTPYLSNLPNNGADFGPDTPSTTTNGWNEFLTYIVTNNLEGYALPGLHTVTGTVTLPGPNLSPPPGHYYLRLRGAGMTQTIVQFVETTTDDGLVIPYNAGGDGAKNQYNIAISDIAFVYGNPTNSNPSSSGTGSPWNQRNLCNFGNINSGVIERVLFTTALIYQTTGTPGDLLSLDPAVVPTNVTSGVVGLMFPNERNTNITVRDCTFALLAAGIWCECDWLYTQQNTFWWCGLKLPSSMTWPTVETQSPGNGQDIGTTTGGGIIVHRNGLEIWLGTSTGIPYVNRHVSFGDHFYECGYGHIFAVNDPSFPTGKGWSLPAVSSIQIHTLIAPAYEIHSIAGTVGSILRVYDDQMLLVSPSFTSAPNFVKSLSTSNNINAIGMSGLDVPNPVPLTANALATNPPVSGTNYQNVGPAVEIYVPVTFNPTVGSAATAWFSTGYTTGTLTALPKFSVPAAGPTGIVMVLHLRVLAGWYWSVTVTNSTIGNGDYTVENT